MTNLTAAPTTRPTMEALGLNTLRGLTMHVVGYVDAGYVDVAPFDAVVEATNFSFDRIVFVEVRHPQRGRLTVSIERCSIVG